MNNKLSIDDRQVMRLLEAMNSRQLGKVERQALQKSARILQKEARRQLRIHGVKNASKKMIRKNGKVVKSPNAGIKVSMPRNTNDVEKEGAKVHIMGNFTLKWFEKGTKIRRSTTYAGKPLKKAANRGQIPGSGKKGSDIKLGFFTEAQKTVKNEVFSSIKGNLETELKKINNKYR